MSAHASASAPTARGQLTLDFAVGISLFVLVVVSVFAFVPGMFGSFDGSAGAPAADRFATTLTADLLGEPSTAGALNETCTAAFFAQLGGGPDVHDGCRFGPETTLSAQLATDRRVNATIETRTGAVVYTAGDAPSDRASIVSATRAVLLGGETHRVVVRVW
ncbi:DUF7287 family protein [Haloferacaceae archaeon DSL9]